MNPLNLFLSVAIIGIGCFATTGVRALGMKAPWPHRDLPYAYDALEPIISKETVETLHLEHQKKYLETANELILRHPDAKHMDQRTIIKEIKDVEIYDNFVHYWNIEFNWRCMTPQNRRQGMGGGGGVPDDLTFIAIAIEKDYGTYDEFLTKIKDTAMSKVGSGWVWLGWDGEQKKLVIIETSGAGNPLTDGIEPLLTINLWEHAYNSNRKDYVDGFFDKLVDWHYVDMNLMLLPGVYPMFNPILEERVFALDPNRR